MKTQFKDVTLAVWHLCGDQMEQQGWKVRGYSEFDCLGKPKYVELTRCSDTKVPPPDYHDGDIAVIDKPDVDVNKVYDRLMQKVGAPVKDAEPEKPKMHDVFLLNDSNDPTGTPFTVVMDVLQEVFHQSAAQAEKTMMEAHNSGRAFIVKMTKELAEQACQEVRIKAAAYPLTCVHEPE